VQEFQTHQEALDGLRQGRVDAYVTDYTLLLNALSLGTATRGWRVRPLARRTPTAWDCPRARTAWPSSMPS
jgi:ABC-type amino acid transport substrate-binding protein